MPVYERKYAVRHWKGLSARSIGHNDTKALLVTPIWPGERVVNIRLSGNTGLTSGNDWETPEINFKGLAVPALDYTWNADTGDTASSKFATPSAVDDTFKGFVVGAGSNADANDYYGSDDDESDIRAVPPKTDIWAGGGMHTWFTREKLMKPVNATQYMDIFDTQVKFGGKGFKASRPTFMIFGAYRFRANVTEEFNAQYMMGLAQSVDGGQTQFAWHPEWVEQQLSPFVTDVDQNSTDDANRQALIEVLSGDNFQESATISDDSAKVAVKCDMTILTPIKSPMLGTA